jgi:hypothetical protein
MAFCVNCEHHRSHVVGTGTATTTAHRCLTGTRLNHITGHEVNIYRKCSTPNENGECGRFEPRKMCVPPRCPSCRYLAASLMGAYCGYHGEWGTGYHLKRDGCDDYAVKPEPKSLWKRLLGI